MALPALIYPQVTLKHRWLTLPENRCTTVVLHSNRTSEDAGRPFPWTEVPTNQKPNAAVMPLWVCDSKRRALFIIKAKILIKLYFSVNLGQADHYGFLAGSLAVLSSTQNAVFAQVGWKEHIGYFSFFSLQLVQHTWKMQAIKENMKTWTNIFPLPLLLAKFTLE